MAVLVSMQICFMMRRLTPIALLLLPLLMLLSTPSLSASGDFFRPLVFYSYAYDNNIYRVPDYAVVANGNDDAIQTLGAGIKLDWQIARQRVELDYVKSKVRYSRHAELDHDGENNRLNWTWSLGNHLNGTAGITDSISQSQFEDTQGVTGNLVTDRNYYINANYRYHPRWQAFLNLSHRERSNDVSENSDTDIDTSIAGLFYRGGTLERLGVQFRQTDGSFPHRTADVDGASGYSEKGINLVADWAPSGKSKLRARIGHVDRVNRGLSGRNYAGLEGRIEAETAASGKVYLSGSIYRDLVDSQIINANHDLRTGLNVSGAYLLTDQSRLGCVLTYENRMTDGELRENDTYSVQLNASKQLWDESAISLSVQRRWRESSDVNLKYKATVINFNATLVF